MVRDSESSQLRNCFEASMGDMLKTVLQKKWGWGYENVNCIVYKNGGHDKEIYNR